MQRALYIVQSGGALHDSAYFFAKLRYSTPGDGKAVKITAKDDDAGGRKLTAISKLVQIVAILTSVQRSSGPC